MKKKYVILASMMIMLLLYVALRLGLFFGQKKPTSRDTIADSGVKEPSHAVARMDNIAGEFIDLFKKPIDFYGKVEDQHGKPVSGATVKIYPVDNPFGTSSANNMVMTSDAEGRFSVKELKGFSVGVSVSKEGYINISPTRWPSSSGKVYADDGLGKSKRYSDPKTPLILRLHDPGQMEPMVYVRSRRCKMSVTGQPYLIALDSEIGVGTHQIEFRFKSDWHKLPDENASNFKQYDWSFEAKIPGGGFAWSSNDYEFVAPETGYSESIKVAYKADMPPEQWKKLAQGSFFVKFADGCHGRIRFDVAGSSEHSPLTLESWFNPKPGSRNLATPHMSASFASDERFEKEWTR